MASFLERLLPRMVGAAGADLTGSGLYTFLNPYTYMVHRAEPSSLEQFDGIFLDGIGLVTALELAGLDPPARASFDMGSLAPRVLHEATRRSRRIYFIGTRPRLVERAVANLLKRYPDLPVAGSRHGYFESDEERRGVARKLAALDPEIVVAGMGAPLQERFLLDVRDAGWTGLGFTCGGFLHQAARGLDSYPPPLADRIHMRWAVRMVREPRILGRVLRHYPAFVLAFVRDARALAKGIPEEA